MNPPESPAQAAYWRRIQRLTGLLLLIWALVAFGLTYFARDLSFTFFGWPFGFWVAAQGAILVFIAIVAYYTHATRKLDELYAER
jgi:putative solute:sodium symporter small subunit